MCFGPLKCWNGGWQYAQRHLKSFCYDDLLTGFILFLLFSVFTWLGGFKSQNIKTKKGKSPAVFHHVCISWIRTLCFQGFHGFMLVWGGGTGWNCHRCGFSPCLAEKLLLRPICVSVIIYFRQIALTSLLCQTHSLWSRSNFGRYSRRAFLIYFLTFLPRCLTLNICKWNLPNKHILWFNWFGPFFSPSHLLVCASNSVHESSLIIFMIRACLLRCHQSLLMVQSPDPCNLDSKYHLNSSGGSVTSALHGGTDTHTHRVKHPIIAISHKTCMMDCFAQLSRPSNNVFPPNSLLLFTFPSWGRKRIIRVLLINRC